jgi:hypothetical protein
MSNQSSGVLIRVLVLVSVALVAFCVQASARQKTMNSPESLDHQIMYSKTVTFRPEPGKANGYESITLFASGRLAINGSDPWEERLDAAKMKRVK